MDANVPIDPEHLLKDLQLARQKAANDASRLELLTREVSGLRRLLLDERALTKRLSASHGNGEVVGGELEVLELKETIELLRKDVAKLDDMRKQVTELEAAVAEKTERCDALVRSKSSLQQRVQDLELQLASRPVSDLQPLQQEPLVSLLDLSDPLTDPLSDPLTDPLSMTITPSDIERNRVVTLERRVEELESQISTRSVQLVELQTSSGAEIARLKAEIAVLSSQKEVQEASTEATDELKATIRRLKSTVEEGKANYQVLAANLKAVSDQLASSGLEISSLKDRLAAAEQEAAVAKQGGHSNQDRVTTLEADLVTVKKQLTEEEEKKSKSIQLLRNSKARILKLEEMVKAKEAENGQLKGELSEVRASAVQGVKERETQMASLTRQVEDMNIRLKRQHQDLVVEGDRRRQRDLEVESLQITVRDLTVTVDKLRAENKFLKEDEQDRKKASETSRTLLEQQSSQLNAWTAQLAELEHRNADLETELDTSQRLFESRSSEHEALKLRCSELERMVYESEQTAVSHTGEVDQLRRDVEKLRADMLERNRDLKKRDQDVKQALKERSEALETAEQRSLDIEREKAELEKVKRLLAALEATNEEWEGKLKVAEDRLREQETAMRTLLEDGRVQVEEKEKVLEDMRVREAHLQKMNKVRSWLLL
ncbi:hypothetical protein HK101_009101 [Irineochytrium annulatum]|nr:hypothetical protein HK101_009101 [Irineochytrium annulatum]